MAGGSEQRTSPGGKVSCEAGAQATTSDPFRRLASLQVTSLGHSVVLCTLVQLSFPLMAVRQWAFLLYQEMFSLPFWGLFSAISAVLKSLPCPLLKANVSVYKGANCPTCRGPGRKKHDATINSRRVQGGEKWMRIPFMPTELQVITCKSTP